MSDARTDARATVFEHLAVVGKAFGSAKRLEIIDLLTQGERSVESLAREAGLGVSTASAHLQVLRMSSLVTTRREGTRVFYRLAGDDVARLYAVMGAIAQTHSADVDRALESYREVVAVGDADTHVLEISRDELRALLAEDDVTLLDVRPAEEFAAGHIPGAVSMPLGKFAEDGDGWEQIPTDREVVAYCRGAFCVMAHDAVRLLVGRGRPARRLMDGMLEWRLEGLPVEVGA